MTILDTMPKGGGGGGGLSREDIVDKICEDLLNKCPPMFDGEDTKDKCAKLPGGPTMPLTVTLRQVQQFSHVCSSTLSVCVVLLCM